MGSHEWRDGKVDGPKFQDATFPGFFRENLVLGKWHSAMQTINLFLVFSALLGVLKSSLESLPPPPSESFIFCPLPKNTMNTVQISFFLTPVFKIR